MTDLQFRALLDWFMSSDPWTKIVRLSQEHHNIIESLLDAQARERGCDNWITAFHKHTPMRIQ